MPRSPQPCLPSAMCLTHPTPISTPPHPPIHPALLCTEAKKYVKVNVAATGDNKSVPARDSWNLSPGEPCMAWPGLSWPGMA